MDANTENMSPLPPVRTSKLLRSNFVASQYIQKLKMSPEYFSIKQKLDNIDPNTITYINKICAMNCDNIDTIIENLYQESIQNNQKIPYDEQNLVIIISILSQLQIIINDIDRLEFLINSNQYREAANLLDEINELMTGNFNSLAQLNTSRQRLQKITNQLYILVYDTFHKYLTDQSSIDKKHLESLCFIIDSLGFEIKRDFMIWICDVELKSYKDSFNDTSDNSLLENIGRRYTWFCHLMTGYYEKWNSIFPAPWGMKNMIYEEFCCITREGIIYELEKRQSNKTLKVRTLLNALRKTIEFQNKMQRKFLKETIYPIWTPKLTDYNRHDMDASVIELGSGYHAMKQRFHARCARNQIHYFKIHGSDSPALSYESTAIIIKTFHTLLSSCFDPYMSIYMTEVDQQIQSVFDSIIHDELWTVNDDEHNKVLWSSQRLMYYFKTTMVNVTEYTYHQAFFDLYKLFKKYFKQYANVLSQKLSTLKVDDDSIIKTVILITNTSDYLSTMTDQLTKEIKKKINIVFQSSVDMSEEKCLLKNISADGVNVLVSYMIKSIDMPLFQMRQQKFSDELSYIDTIESIFNSKIQLIYDWLIPSHYRFFCDLLAVKFFELLTQTIYQYDRITEMTAEQLLLDVCHMKKIFATIKMDKIPGSSSSKRYMKLVNEEAGKVEMILKVLMIKYTPQQTLITDMYNALIANRSESDFVKILKLKGLKKIDQKFLLETYQNRKINGDSPSITISSDILGENISIQNISIRNISIQNIFDIFK